MKEYKKSEIAFQKALKVIAGGVNSPVRAFRSVGGIPRFFTNGSGAWITDLDGNQYIDYVCSWGPLILGHAHPQVIEEVISAAKRGCSFGAPTEAETELAELIVSMIPSIEVVRLVNSGTEAAMSAIRLARGITKRDLIIKFEGCYHGHGDSFLIAAGSGALTLGIPDSPGVTSATASQTIIVPYNDIDALYKIFKEFGEKIAACIVEPVAGNMGVVLPDKEFLETMRKLTKEYEALLIFDEVITGLRVAAGGAQEYYNIMPDITVLGKIIGGGMPVGAYGAKREIMDYIAPVGPIYQAGTLSGNPVAVASGIATLKQIKKDPEFYIKLERKSAKLAEGIKNNCISLGIPFVLNRIGSMMTLFFTELKEIKNYRDAKASNTTFFKLYFHECLEEGIYLPPSQFEAMFVSAAHTEEEIEITIERNYVALKRALEKYKKLE
ncbi:MAG: glutamate-1-semialdehyde 2,1-aminomutase [Chitinispirillaceae bacterium]|nr:glutamate-1-semialdehyde 2,1-aminomutase [Chitinispirillaceae bacterium]